MHFKYSHDLKELSQLAVDLEAFGEENAINPAIIPCFNLCLDEVLTNIISYGYDDGPEHAAHLTLSLADEIMTAEIRDEGRAFNPLEDAPEPDLESEIEDRDIGGLGIHFCKEMMDKLEYRREGDWNILTMSKSVALPALDD
ncbi:ATP-binding protein [Rubellicoccus peritrichatus]|uniref:ATP-binding protein n=1 Tax=Rubellicoccus peritrichatus TaxID=3080537 RepID=A0AAQ3LG80_9BACT|nr:ATP-binding protein [Puniceicoccus sp. CR14]WOO43258.1 ATP-binding protein [Puniceicoccus sp. CR14]